MKRHWFRSYPAGPQSLEDRTDGTAMRRHHEKRGRIAEWIACGLLMAKGYRILARRVRTPSGELDIVAVRGRRLAFVEVKRRAQVTEAGASVGRRQADRIKRAAEYWTWRHQRYRAHTIGLDTVTLAKGVFPRHVSDSLQPIQ